MSVEQQLTTLRNKKVGIAGCGGLGSNCAVALARIGVGTLVIADFDRVTMGNLNRQYYFLDQVGKPKVIALKENIRRIDPSVTVLDHPEKLTPENIPVLFHDCDVVVEAFDLADQKQMLLEAMLEFMPEKPLVMGLGMAGWGNSDSIHLRKAGNIYICGDEVSEIGPDTPPLAPRVGIVANMQANVVTDLLLKDDQHSAQQ